MDAFLCSSEQMLLNTASVSVELYLVRCELYSGGFVHQLEGHSKVLVAVSQERGLGFARIIHSKKKNKIG